jgi:LysM repeat protein
MKKNTLIVVALALLLIAPIVGCKRPKPIVSEVQAIPTPTATPPPGRTVIPVASPTPTPGVIPTITPTPRVEAATPTATIVVEATPTVALTPTLVPTITPTPVPTEVVSGERIHVVQPGENLFRIALHYGMTWTALAAANGIVNPDLIYPGQRLRIPAEVPVMPTEERIHVVQPGENLFRIAIKYGTTVEAIAVANNIRDVHLIYVGQRLRIPE